jgi:hypothetical protein
MDEQDYSVVSFTNPSGSDFTWAWGGKPYTIKAGETKFYPEFLAKHLAKHLVDRCIGTSNNYHDANLRAEWEAQILGGVVMEAEKPEPMSEGEKVAKTVEKLQEEVEAKVSEQVEEAFAELVEETPVEVVEPKAVEAKPKPKKK